MNDQEIISKLLSTIEAVILNDKEGDILSSDELEEYCIIAITAHKKYGRRCNMVHDIIDQIGGLHIGALIEAGLTYEDQRAVYHQKAA